MELHRTSPARPHRTWTAQDPQSPPRDPLSRLLPPKERLVVVAPAPARLPQVAHHLPLLKTMALREGIWERINRTIRERLRVRLGRDPLSPERSHSGLPG